MHLPICLVQDYGAPCDGEDHASTAACPLLQPQPQLDPGMPGWHTSPSPQPQQPQLQPHWGPLAVGASPTALTVLTLDGKAVLWESRPHHADSQHHDHGPEGYLAHLLHGQHDPQLVSVTGVCVWGGVGGGACATVRVCVCVCAYNCPLNVP